MGRRRLILAGLILLAAGFLGCARPAVAPAMTIPVATAPRMTEAPLSALQQGDWSAVDLIVVSDGRGGSNKHLTIADTEGIKRFVEMLDGYRVVKLINVDPVSGWTHRAKLYCGDKVMLDIIFGQPMQVGEVYYRVEEGAQSPRELDELLHGIDAAWKINNR